MRMIMIDQGCWIAADVVVSVTVIPPDKRHVMVELSTGKKLVVRCENYEGSIARAAQIAADVSK